MTSPAESEEHKDKMVLYALGALDDDEAALIADRLRSGDEASAAELVQAEKLIALMGYQALAAAPPPALKRRLFDRIQPAPSPQPAAGLQIDFASLDWTPSDWPGVDVHWLRQDETTGAGAVYYP